MFTFWVVPHFEKGSSSLGGRAETYSFKMLFLMKPKDLEGAPVPSGVVRMLFSDAMEGAGSECNMVSLCNVEYAVFH